LQKEGITLILQLEDAARDVLYHADQLKAFNRSSQVSRWTHLHHLNMIKELVSEGVKPALTDLEKMQPKLPAWKQQSIDKMLEAARNLAGDTTSAILSKNDVGSLPPALNPPYLEAVVKVNSHAETLVKMADAASNYASAHLKAAEAGVPVAK